MNSREREGAIPKKFFCGLASLAAFLILTFSLSVRSVAMAGSDAGFQMTLPEKSHTGEPIKIHVRFSTEAPSHAFFRLQVDVDGKPVAMADMSDERSSWITLEPQSAGRHEISIIWRNPPGGSPISQGQTLTVASESSPGPSPTAGDSKN